jgi:prepilin-type N-terminal cleavage/methylation domain-containing protein
MMLSLRKLFSRIEKQDRGMTLVELLIALSIMGMTVVFVGGLFTGFKIIPADRDAINAEAIARSQMEYVMSSNYTDNATSYSVMTGIPSGYYVPAPIAIKIDPNNIGTTPVNDLGIQRVTINIYKGNSVNGDPLITLMGYKLKKW